MRRCTLLLLAAGCASGVSRPGIDGSVDAAVDAAVDGTVDAITIADRPPDGPWHTGLPLPTNVPPPRRFFDQRAKLTGGGDDSCSHQDPPSGDGHRWCSVSLPGTNGALELWVIDVSRAAAGQVPRCDGTDAGCLRLTDQLWTAFSLYGPAHPYAHAFTGDTLIFYVGTPDKPDAVYRGPVYAWRPGWPKAHPISSATGLLCYGHTHAEVGFCIEDVAGSPEHPDSVEVHGGPITADGGPLPSLGRLRPFRSTGGDAAWEWGFSRDGDVLAISSPDPDPAVQSVRAIAVKDIGRAMPAEVVRDAGSWTISNDGKSLYFVRDDLEGPALFVADFPSGANAVKLIDQVQDYFLLGNDARDQGVGALSKATGSHLTFSLARSRDQFPTAIFAAGDMIEGVTVSSDLRYTGWVSAQFNARLVDNTGFDVCLLNTAASRAAYTPQFFDGAPLVVWEEDGDDDNNRRDGFFGHPDRCGGRTRYAEGLDFVHPVGARAAVYGDELDGDYRVTLKYAALENGAWPAAPVRVAEKVKTDLGAILVGTNPLLIVYEVATGDAATDGLYVFTAPF